MASIDPKKKKELLELINRKFSKKLHQIVNFQILTAHFLNDLGIKFTEIVDNRDLIMERLKKRFHDNKPLLEIVEKSIKYWALPGDKPRLIMEIYPGETIVKKTPGDYWIEYYSCLQDFLNPTPEFYKTFLLLGRIEPMLSEIVTLFFERLEKLKANKQGITKFFKEIIVKFGKPIDLNAAILSSRYLREFTVDKISVSTIKNENDLKNYFQELSRLFQNSLERFSKKADIFASLSKNKRELIADEVVNLLYKVLEGPVKTILWIINNFQRVEENRVIFPMDRTLGDYANILGLRNLEFKYLRDASGHFSYDIESSAGGGRIDIIFKIQERYLGAIQHERKSLDEVFALLQILNASTHLFQLFMESYILNEELIKKYDKTLDEMHEESLNAFKELVWASEMRAKFHSFYQKSDFKRAFKCIEELLEKNPQGDDLWIDRGICFYRINKLQNALDCFQKAVQINADSMQGWYHQALTLNEMEQFNAGIQCVDTAIQLDPNYAMAWALKGLLLYHLEQYEQALSCYEKTFDLDYKDNRVLNNYAAVLIKLRRFKEANKCLDDILATKPNEAMAYYNKACIAALEADPISAISFLQKSIHLDPERMNWARTDSDFDNIKNEPAFQKLLEL